MARRKTPCGIVGGASLLQATTPSIEERVLAGRIATLVSQQPMAILANLVNSGLLALLMSGAWPETWLTVWVAGVWLVTALRGAVWLRYRRGSAGTAQAKNIGRLLTGVALVSGAVWGLPAVVFFPESPLALQGFIVFVLGGMSAGAVATLASHLPAFHSFIIPALLPLVGRLLLEGDLLYIAMGLMGGIYFLVLTTTGINLNRTLTRALRLQIEKSDLVDDLTEARAKAEAASVSKSAFLATVSHELRTPLNAVIGFTQLLEAEVHGPLGHGKYHEYLGHMSGSGTHLLNLIDELLDLSRAEAGQLAIRDEATVDLAAELTHCVALMTVRAEHRGICLVTSLPEDLPRLRADPQRLRQIVLNVLSNAVKFTPEDGLVELSATREPTGTLVLNIRDTGIGMSEGDLAVALEFFGRADNARSRATEGTGIGLPLTVLLLEMHGGKLEVASQPGGGTLVNLRFPPERVIECADAAEAPAQEDKLGPSPAA
jgi:two-component system cell cycle sensor histidine kinase PleC